MRLVRLGVHEHAVVVVVTAPSTVEIEQLAEALFIHAICDTTISSIKEETAHQVWRVRVEPLIGESDWRDDYREHATHLLARLLLVQKWSRPEPADE